MGHYHTPLHTIRAPTYPRPPGRRRERHRRVVGKRTSRAGHDGASGATSRVRRVAGDRLVVCRGGQASRPTGYALDPTSRPRPSVVAVTPTSAYKQLEAPNRANYRPESLRTVRTRPITNIRLPGGSPNFETDAKR